MKTKINRERSTNKMNSALKQGVLQPVFPPVFNDTPLSPHHHSVLVNSVFTPGAGDRRFFSGKWLRHYTRPELERKLVNLKHYLCIKLGADSRKRLLLEISTIQDILRNTHPNSARGGQSYPTPRRKVENPADFMESIEKRHDGRVSSAVNGLAPHFFTKTIST